MIQNFTDNKKTNYSINTRMRVRDKIKEILKGLTKVEQIALLESLSKEIRQKNSIRISKRQFKDTRIDDREDELKLKGEM